MLLQICMPVAVMFLHCPCACLLLAAVGNLTCIQDAAGGRTRCVVAFTRRHPFQMLLLLKVDTCPAAFEMLPAIAAEVGKQVPVLVDGGIRRGTDVIKVRPLALL